MLEDYEAEPIPIHVVYREVSGNFMFNTFGNLETNPRANAIPLDVFN